MFHVINGSTTPWFLRKPPRILLEYLRSLEATTQPLKCTVRLEISMEPSWVSQKQCCNTPSPNWVMILALPLENGKDIEIVNGVNMNQP